MDFASVVALDAQLRPPPRRRLAVESVLASGLSLSATRSRFCRWTAASQCGVSGERLCAPLNSFPIHQPVNYQSLWLAQLPLFKPEQRLSFIAVESVSTMNDRAGVDVDGMPVRADEHDTRDAAAIAIEQFERSDSECDEGDAPVGQDDSGEENGVLSSDASADAGERLLHTRQSSNGDAARGAAGEGGEGKEDGVSGRERLMQRLWQRAAGMRSDLVVTFGDKTQYDLHKFPLYSKVRGTVCLGVGDKTSSNFQGRAVHSTCTTNSHASRWMNATLMATADSSRPSLHCHVSFQLQPQLCLLTSSVPHKFPSIRPSFR